MIDVTNIFHRYPGASRDALSGVTLSFPPGSFVALMGSNGSGKSTFARCLNGLVVPFSGSVSIDGMRTDDKAFQCEIRRRVGLIFQDPRNQITSITVEREIAFGLQHAGMEYAQLHDIVGRSLKNFGLESCRTQTPHTLSGGEQQKLAIASVMALDPRYLVLDEATSLLSARSRTLVLQRVSKLREERKVAIILITQFPSEALIADRLVVLHDGRVQFDGTPDVVFENSDALQSLGVAVPPVKMLERFL